MKAQGWAVFVIVFLILFFGVGSFIPSTGQYARALSGIKGVLSLFIAWQVTKRYRGQEASSGGGNIITDEDSDPAVDSEDDDLGDVELFEWILDLEAITGFLSTSPGCPEYLLESTFKLRRKMMERLYATGGEFAERHRGWQGG